LSPLLFLADLSIIPRLLELIAVVCIAAPLMLFQVLWLLSHKIILL